MFCFPLSVLFLNFSVSICDEHKYKSVGHTSLPSVLVVKKSASLYIYSHCACIRSVFTDVAACRSVVRRSFLDQWCDPKALPLICGVYIEIVVAIRRAFSCRLSDGFTGTVGNREHRLYVKMNACKLLLSSALRCWGC